MKVLVDTSVWSMALRRNTNTDISEVNELSELINEMRAVVIGPVRQELLSGISTQKSFDALKERLQAFDDMPLRTEDYELAAGFYNLCRRNGIQGSHIDYLICAAAINNNCSIFTMDKDFTEYQKYIKLKLHMVRDDISNL